MAGRWAMFLESKPWEGSRALHMRVEMEGGGFAVVQPFVLTVFKDSVVDMPVEPVMKEHLFAGARDGYGQVTGFLQAALDLAWETGMRPAGFEDHKSEVTAVRAHLEDMRTLALKPQGKA